MTKPSSFPRHKVSIVVALLLFVTTPFLVVYGTGPLAEALPCISTQEWFTNRLVCVPDSLRAALILLCTPVIAGFGLILTAVLSRR